ncbi:unnamed protein product [Sphagnum troendelagicum]|uniref:Uncharacterized protein n=1 Tax=Sphagnum troendelagicum TaxID=128251 RepID=A0ABP0TNS7_9BRYO
METGAWPSSQGLRVKRGAITASRRAAGPSTPVPSWNVFNNQLYDGIAAAAAAASLHAVAGRSTPVSARKLAASLWELQDVPVPGIFGSTGDWHSSAKESSDTTSLMSQADHLSYRSPRISTKFSNEQLSKVRISSSFAAEKHFQTSCSEMKGEVKAGKFNSVTTSTELLKVLSRICILEEQHDLTISTTSSLRVQLDQALAHVQELELAQNAAHKEIESLTKKLANVKSSWKIEQNKLQLVVQSLKEEVETEQKARTRVEVANQKMTKELLDANMAVAKVVQELERERKAHELMEDVCDELAREISDDKAEVEDLKRDSIKMHEELEEERRMLQLAEVWREERVQMKLGEAKLLLEEKGAALDVLRSELEKFLWAGRLRNRGDFVQEAEVLHNVVAAFHPREIPHMSLISPVNDIQKRTLKQLQAAETKDGDGCKYEHVSRSSQASKYGDSMEAVAYEKSYLEVNDDDDDDDPLYQHNEDSSDGVVHQASEIDDEDHHQLYEEVETVGGMKQPGEVAWKVHGMEDARVTPLREKKNYGQEDAVNEVNLHGHTQEVEWETVPQQSSWISRNNPHIERGMKGHVLWPKGFMDAAIKKEKSILN